MTSHPKPSTSPATASTFPGRLLHLDLGQIRGLGRAGAYLSRCSLTGFWTARLVLEFTYREPFALTIDEYDLAGPEEAKAKAMVAKWSARRLQNNYGALWLEPGGLDVDQWEVLR